MRNFLVLAILFLACSPAHALGVGDISVKSRLGEPLRAEIDVYATDKELASDLAVTLAPQEIFSRSGVHMTRAVSGLNFEVARNENGMPVIVVSTKDIVHEPTVTFLIEVEWTDGRLLRQYSVLLQPR